MEKPFSLPASKSDDINLTPNLEYDYYQFTCSQVESSVRTIGVLVLAALIQAMEFNFAMR